VTGARPRRAPGRPQPLELGGASAQNGGLRRQLGRQLGGGELEGRVLAQDRLVKPAQVGSRLGADLLHQHRARGPVGLQRLGLPTGAVQGKHAQPVQPLAQRVLGNERVEPAVHLTVAARLEIALERELERGEAKLLEPPCLGHRERLVHEVGERRSAPERERPVRGLTGAAVVVASRGLGEEPLEPGRVHRVVVEPQLVAATVRHDLRSAVLAEQLAELRHVELHHLRRAGGLILAPEALDQPVHRYGGVRVQGEQGQHCTLLRPTEGGRPIAELELDRAKNTYLHREPRSSLDPLGWAVNFRVYTALRPSLYRPP
jgi:hypothetical protein